MASANLLLIDSRIPDINGITSSLTGDTDYIIFDYYADTFETIKQKINRQYVNVGLVQHNYELPSCFILHDMSPAILTNVAVDDPHLASWDVSLNKPIYCDVSSISMRDVEIPFLDENGEQVIEWTQIEQQATMIVDVSSVQMQEVEVPLLDENGNEMLDENGQTLTTTRSFPLLDSDGQPVITWTQQEQLVFIDVSSVQMQTVSVPLLDSSGNEMLDENGEPLMTQQSIPLLDSDGQPLIVWSQEPQMVMVDVSNVKMQTVQEPYLDGQGNPFIAWKKEPTGVVETSIGFFDFLRWLKENGAKYVDFLACYLWASADWRYVIGKLKNDWEVWVRASIDITGWGGNFILESDGVDLIDVYFTEKIFQYKYAFIGNDFINIINSKVPWGVYSATKYSNVTNKLYEIRNNGRDATVTGTLTPGKSAGNGSSGQIQFLNGITSNKIVWPSGSIPAVSSPTVGFTMAAITRWTGNKKGRILSSTGNTPNFFLGHHLYGSGGGTVYYNNYMVSNKLPDLSNNWLVMVARVVTGANTKSNILFDGVESSDETVTITSAAASTLCINNYNGGVNDDISNFGFSYLMIWDTPLTNTEMVIVSDQLRFYLRSGFEPPVVSAYQSVLNAKRPWGIYRAIDWNSTTKTLPEARGIPNRQVTCANSTNAPVLITSTVANGINTQITCLSGNSLDRLYWPLNSLSTSFSLAFTNRYVGKSSTSTNMSLFSNSDFNNYMLFGHYENSPSEPARRGVYYLYNVPSYTFVQYNNIGTLTNWLPMVVKQSLSTRLIVDGVSYTGNTPPTIVSDSKNQLMLSDSYPPSSFIRWEFGYLAIWHEQLTDTESVSSSTELLSYLGTGVIPAKELDYGYVLNGYFNNPVVASNSYIYYLNTFPIPNWDITIPSGNGIAISNQSVNWGYSTPLPPGTTQWIVFDFGYSSATATMSQNINFQYIGPYTLTYYTHLRPDPNPNLSFSATDVSHSVSIAGSSYSSYVSTKTSWQLHTLNFKITSTGYKQLLFQMIKNNTSPADTYLTAINIQPTESVPFEPTITSITPGNGQLTVAFTAPLSDGNYPITTYKYSLNGGALQNASATTSPFTISSLTNGTSYNVYIVATNSLGDSSASNIISATPRTLPSAPTLESLTPGNTTISMAFTAPASDGGSAILGYKYNLNGGAFIDISNQTSPYLITGLTNVQSYSITLKAYNAAGDSTASSSLSATPFSITSGFVFNSSGVYYGWSYSGSVAIGNGSAISGGAVSLPSGYMQYLVQYIPSPELTPCVLSQNVYLTAGEYLLSFYAIGSSQLYNSAHTITANISDASYNTGALSTTTWTYYTYNFSVSTDGTYPLSLNSTSSAESVLGLTAVDIQRTNTKTISLASTPYTVPSAPTINSITPGTGASAGTISVAFTAPASDGGSPIIGYKYKLNASAYVDISMQTSPYVITGLLYGHSYTVTLKAYNAAGDSPESASMSTTTQTGFTIPAPPTITSVVAGLNTATIYFTAGSSGGTPILGYKYSINDSSYTEIVDGVSSPLTVAVTPGISSILYLKAYNSVGDSSASNGSASFVAYTYPSAPLVTSLVAGYEKLTVKFLQDSSGYSPITGYKYSIDGGNTYTSTAYTQSPFDISTNISVGNAYTIKLIAVTQVDSSASNVSNSAVPYTKPTAPTITRVVYDGSNMTLTFTPPSNSGGVPIQKYSYSINGGQYVDYYKP
jgi:hypothetical protein